MTVFKNNKMQINKIEKAGKNRKAKKKTVDNIFCFDIINKDIEIDNHCHNVCIVSVHYSEIVIITIKSGIKI